MTSKLRSQPGFTEGAMGHSVLENVYKPFICEDKDEQKGGSFLIHF